MIPPPPVQSRALCHTSINLVICILKLMLRDFGGRSSISLSVQPRPIHQRAPKPLPEARSARQFSQYPKPMRYFSSALSGPAPVPPELLHTSSALPGRANLPRQRVTAHAPLPASMHRSARLRRRLCPARNNRGVRAGHLPLTSAQSSCSPHEPPEAA